MKRAARVIYLSFVYIYESRINICINWTNQLHHVISDLIHMMYESWTTLLLNPIYVKDKSLWSSQWCLIRTHHNYPFSSNTIHTDKKDTS